jgi:hypothetical protein
MATCKTSNWINKHSTCILYMNLKNHANQPKQVTQCSTDYWSSLPLPLLLLYSSSYSYSTVLLLYSSSSSTLPLPLLFLYSSSTLLYSTLPLLFLYSYSYSSSTLPLPLTLLYSYPARDPHDENTTNGLAYTGDAAGLQSGVGEQWDQVAESE